MQRKKNKRAWPWILLCLALTAVFLLLPTWLQGRPGWVETYSTTIFPILSFLPVKVMSFIPISVTEIVVLALIISLPVLSVLYVYRLKKSRDRRRYLIRTFLATSVAACVLSASYTAMHGLNFMRQDLNASLEVLSARLTNEVSLEAVCLFLADGAVFSRRQLDEDNDGVVMLMSDLDETLMAGNDVMDLLAKRYPALSGPAARPKAVTLSRQWSYTGISGMYFPFLGEANINVDAPTFRLPFTICHELAHVRGFAREEDANAIAFLACINSGRADFEYAGYHSALIFAMADLAAEDEAAHARVQAVLCEGFFDDAAASNAYWASFQRESWGQSIRATSTRANDAFLRANRQPDGVISYSQMTDFVVDYYYDVHAGQ